MVRRLFIFTLLLLSTAEGKLKTDSLAEGVILFNPDNGAILFEKNAYTSFYPASITKLVTALVALEKKGESLEQVIAASQESVGSVTEEAKKRSGYSLPSWWLVKDASHIGIKKGEEFSLRELLYGMLLSSGDDASNVIAEFAGGTIPQFIADMNHYVERLGLEGTYFTNPHGLFHPEQKTTAYDMALVMKEVLKNPILMEILASKSHMRPKTNKQEATPLVQTNRLVRAGPYYYSKILGGKTGHLALSQNTFVVAAQDGDRKLILVLLKVKERQDLWKESIRLFDMAFQEPKVEKTFLAKGVQKNTLTLPTFSKPIEAILKEDLVYSYYPAEEQKVRGLIHWRSLLPPVKAGDVIGEIQLVDTKGNIRASNPLFAKEEVGATWSYYLRQLFLSLKTLSGMMTALALFLVLGFGLFFFNSRRLSR